MQNYLPQNGYVKKKIVYIEAYDVGFEISLNDVMLTPAKPILVFVFEVHVITALLNTAKFVRQITAIWPT